MAKRMMRRKADRRRLEPIRKRLGLTQQEIADDLGVHVRTWAKWIAGERACPWSVWLALQAMEAVRGEGKGKKKGEGRKVRRNHWSRGDF